MMDRLNLAGLVLVIVLCLSGIAWGVYAVAHRVFSA